MGTRGFRQKGCQRSPVKVAISVYGGSKSTSLQGPVTLPGPVTLQGPEQLQGPVTLQGPKVEGGFGGHMGNFWSIIKNEMMNNQEKICYELFSADNKT